MTLYQVIMDALHEICNCFRVEVTDDEIYSIYKDIHNTIVRGYNIGKIEMNNGYIANQVKRIVEFANKDGVKNITDTTIACVHFDIWQFTAYNIKGDIKVKVYSLDGTKIITVEANRNKVIKDLMNILNTNTIDINEPLDTLLVKYGPTYCGDGTALYSADSINDEGVLKYLCQYDAVGYVYKVLLDNINNIELFRISVFGSIKTGILTESIEYIIKKSRKLYNYLKVVEDEEITYQKLFGTIAKHISTQGYDIKYPEVISVISTHLEIDKETTKGYYIRHRDPYKALALSYLDELKYFKGLTEQEIAHSLSLGVHKLSKGEHKEQVDGQEQHEQKGIMWSYIHAKIAGITITNTEIEQVTQQIYKLAQKL